jgi:purine-nucleoside phosphorylase
MVERNELAERLNRAADALRRRIGARRPTIGIILGSGLNPLAEKIEDAVFVPFREVPFMRQSTADGHVGRFVCGDFAGVCVLAMQGRLHGYEGCSAVDVAFPVWLMNRLGIRQLVTTNAAGAVNAAYQVGDFCVMNDQINLTGRNPIANLDAAGLAERFFSMLDCFDPRLRAIAREAALETGVRVQEGVYLGVLGPSFETRAEIRAFRTLGADTVAMSVCEEVIAARHVDMSVLGMSLITNMACGIQGSSPNEEEIRDVGASREDAFEALMRSIVPRMAGEAFCAPGV